MQSKGNAPTAAEKRYREEVRSLGCITCGISGREQVLPTEIHHIVGASAKDSGVRVGHLYLLPLCSGCHRTYHTKQDGRPNVTTEKQMFEKMYGEELELFADVIEALGYDPFEGIV